MEWNDIGQSTNVDGERLGIRRQIRASIRG